jgi:farnesyl-diphosphate farnesyltransferase
MNVDHSLHNKAKHFLEKTSRTFVIPISQLPDRLRDTVGAAYLCMRAIDEIEDHSDLSAEVKIELLNSIASLLQTDYSDEKLSNILQHYQAELPEVTLFLTEWIELCPPDIRDKVFEATSSMARGMAKWVQKDWQIQNEADLDEYTYYVAGLVGVMLSDLWKWYDGTETDRELAVAFGRGLQTVNILRNRAEDADRGVNFFPENWGFEEMFRHTKRNLALADDYVKDIQTQGIRHFCQIPLAFANATLEALQEGREKITRDNVNDIVNNIITKP